MRTTLKDAMDNSVIEKLFIYNAEPKNLDMFVNKSIQLIKFKFDMKKFKRYLS